MTNILGLTTLIMLLLSGQSLAAEADAGFGGDGGFGGDAGFEGDGGFGGDAGFDGEAEQPDDPGFGDAPETAGTPGTAAPAQGQGGVLSNDRFVPSTQISEDLSVSFPVDI